ncbi:MAG: organoarsenical effux MFS transporter ArsJ [Alphaproteobacteria bacterium]
MTDIRNYAVVTTAYWGFTLTDGALRMLVLLHFHTLGYSPLEVAFLFLFYEFFGIVTNLVGGWIAARLGLKTTLFGGLALQIVALAMLAQLSPEWSRWTSVAYVMAAQALSGIAKDLTKMSSKSAIKLVVPQNAESALFKWVAILTGSKNALKGAGFFLGGLLLATLGFVDALYAMAAALAVVLAGAVTMLPRGMGKSKSKAKFSAIFSKSREINILSAARFFLFASRDVWFVVGLPVFLYATLGWSFTEVGGFLALWVIGYGMVQSVAPKIMARRGAPDGPTARNWAFLLAAIQVGIVAALAFELDPAVSVVTGLLIFGIAFALNSSLHSYLILSYSDADKVALNVGFYYMANAGGRLVGTVLSGLAYQQWGLVGCLWFSVGLVLCAALLSMLLPAGTARAVAADDLAAAAGE